MKTKELCDILGVTNIGLKSILRRDQLAVRLLEKGYRFISKEKRGVYNEFFVEEVVMIPKEEWEVYMKKEFPNVRKKDEYGDYCEERLINNEVIAKHISKNVGVTPQTLVRWDSLLVKKGVMTNNGYSYFHLKTAKCKPVQITYGEYISFWNNYFLEHDEERKVLKTVEGESPITHDMLYATLYGGTCIKVKSYLVNEFTEAYESLTNALGNRKGKA